MKKILKLTLCLIGIASVAIGIYYYFTKKKHSSNTEKALNSFSEEEEDSTDFLDLSSLKFSRHYVDLR